MWEQILVNRVEQIPSLSGVLKQPVQRPWIPFCGLDFAQKKEWRCTCHMLQLVQVFCVLNGDMFVAGSSH